VRVCRKGGVESSYYLCKGGFYRGKGCECRGGFIDRESGLGVGESRRDLMNMYSRGKQVVERGNKTKKLYQQKGKRDWGYSKESWKRLGSKGGGEGMKTQQRGERWGGGSTGGCRRLE